MKRIIAALLLSMLATWAMADDMAAKKQAAMKVLEASNTEAIYAEARKQIETMGEQALTQSIPDDQTAMRKRYHKRMETVLSEGLDWKAMKTQMVKVYMDTFSLEELKDMADFYQSPTGRSIMKKMPAVMTQSVQLSQQQMQRVMPALQQMFSDLDAELAQQQAKASAGKNGDSQE
ncbi:hypothetical protein A11A3_09942 [Alcanivorax hongdengensis A-11-3]|uniref:DUF2059 domain-containing protein n=1 Tax=Alcanivorax hongdengensis A-11-3 TaxID=1177179 RepID=L0WAY2_9GAMM|nr:DUF2059 domain-containing protein [Alcanivorax hongdengensis]EKF74131.1 hypothetical protein A11A3_09942 [Alcanivorax hongdengensis A-11-3]